MFVFTFFRAQFSQKGKQYEIKLRIAEKRGLTYYASLISCVSRVTTAREKQEKKIKCTRRKNIFISCYQREYLHHFFYFLLNAIKCGVYFVSIITVNAILHWFDLYIVYHSFMNSGN